MFIRERGYTQDYLEVALHLGEALDDGLHLQAEFVAGDEVADQRHLVAAVFCPASTRWMVISKPHRPATRPPTGDFYFGTNGEY
jgi:hypothetical protein